MANNAVVYRGTPTYTPGKFGNALSGGVLGAPNALDFFAEGAGASLDGTVTLEAWVKLNAAPGANKVIAGRDYVLWMGVNSAGQVIATVGGGAGQYQLNSGTAIADAAWHHVAVTIESGRGSLFVDGVKKASSTSVAARNATSVYDGMWIGGYGASGTGFDWPGQIEDVAVSTTARYSSDFTPPAAAFANTRPGQVNLWHLEADGSDSDAADSEALPEPDPEAPVLLPPNDPRYVYSPYNWSITAARALTINGGYVRTLITGAPASISLAFDVANVPANTLQQSQVAYRLDAGDWVVATVAAAMSVPIPAATRAWAKHTLEIVVKSTTENQNRWNSPYLTGVKFLGVRLPPTASIAKPETRSLNILCYGDSITEGIGVLSNAGDTVARSDTRLSWAYLLRETLGAEVGVVGFGGQGITRNGLGGIPNMGASWDKIANGIPRVFDPIPDAVVINQGTNDARNGVTVDTFKPALTAVLNQIATATPDQTKIVVLVPFGGFYGEAAYAAAVAAMTTPRRAVVVNTSGWWANGDSSDSLHPYGYANVNALSPLAAEAIRQNLGGAGRTYINIGGQAVSVTPRRV